MSTEMQGASGAHSSERSSHACFFRRIRWRRIVWLVARSSGPPGGSSELWRHKEQGKSLADVSSFDSSSRVDEICGDRSIFGEEKNQMLGCLGGVTLISGAHLALKVVAVSRAVSGLARKSSRYGSFTSGPRHGDPVVSVADESRRESDVNDKQANPVMLASSIASKHHRYKCHYTFWDYHPVVFVGHSI
ncbi:hypothetical protein EYF80_057629 [Liparis tanakae]|uniref:Uncharacterized protein n=1 Tax=Liparis tanakae TaxID=230148 RepID=A0A4Z2ETT4_9TELE|nr:hypothetical protein EYF80_057629 [Liparis tanakae]